MKETMKAVGFYKYLPIEYEDSFIDVTVEKPKAQGTDIVVRVEAISINPIDTKIRVSKTIEEESPRIIGWDVAGIVESVGPDVTMFHVGDEVYYAGDVTRAGCYSEYHLVDEKIVALKPKTLSFEEAAALPLTSLAAYEAMFERLNISKHQKDNVNKTLLIINASGGVGSMALQFAHHVNLTTIATASRPETIQWAKKFHANHIINHRDDLVLQLRALGYDHVDYILCLHDTNNHWEAMSELVAPLGSVCSLVTATEPLDMLQFKDKSATFSYEYMFTKAQFNVAMKSQHDILQEVAQLVDDKIVETTIYKTIEPINAENMKKAHQLLESQQSIGKIVMSKFE